MYNPSVLDLILLDRLILWLKDYSYKEINIRIEKEKNPIIRYKLRNLYPRHMGEKK